MEEPTTLGLQLGPTNVNTYQHFSLEPEVELSLFDGTNAKPSVKLGNARDFSSFTSPMIRKGLLVYIS